MTQGCNSLSIIVPLYNEQENIDSLQARLVAVMQTLDGYAVEVLLIDDGSTDETSDKIHQIVQQDQRFKAITLTRNFGHQAAVSKGLELCGGQVVAVIDGDLQDPPEQIPVLLAALDQGADVAYGVRQRRKETWLKRCAYASFYRILKRVAEIDIPVDSGDFCCMRRCVVDAMLSLPERNRFVRGLRAWVGYKQVAVPYERAARFAGRPAYTWTKLIQLALNGLFSFTSVPVRIAQLLGFVISMSAIVIAAGYLTLFLLRPEWFPQGFATITISIWLLAGVQLFFLGLLGEYLVRTFDEVRRRPTAIVAKISQAPPTWESVERTGAEAEGVEHPEAADADRDQQATRAADIESRVAELVRQLQEMTHVADAPDHRTVER